jgi:hypothetical protein
MDVTFVFLTFYCINFYVEIYWSSIPDTIYGIVYYVTESTVNDKIWFTLWI